MNNLAVIKKKLVIFYCAIDGMRMMMGRYQRGKMMMTTNISFELKVKNT